MSTVLVPPRAGVLSAVGILGAARQHDLVRTWPGRTDRDGLEEALTAMAAEAAAALGGGGDVEVTSELDCRYQGQSHELRVPTVAAFAAEHERRNGYARPDTPVEVVALRASARRPVPLALEDLPVPARAAAVGPSVVAEDDCTVFVAPGWRADPGPLGTLVLTREAS